ncbi:hypothetical protein [Dyadobacter bucti]|uniref:hypothetical protein n=1 Tax=Dyadobacter bucti TaxID=2572203 RepID=UPI001108CFF3|nr:hypothetical protein [Dyadobacter bucti]
MKARKPAVLIVLLFFAGLNACQNDLDSKQVYCTDIFIGIRIKVSGGPLTDHYTVRMSSSDTIRRPESTDPQTQWYTVLDDNYQRKLANQEDVFRFIGKRGDVIVVEEDYVIGADECHVYKVSGKDEI